MNIYADNVYISEKKGEIVWFERYESAIERLKANGDGAIINAKTTPEEELKLYLDNAREAIGFKIHRDAEQETENNNTENQAKK